MKHNRIWTTVWICFWLMPNAFSAPKNTGSGFTVEHVLFGERDRSRFQTALFLDAMGTPYPDWFIADSTLMQGNATLLNWYQRHPEAFEAICGHYRFSAVFSLENFRRLNDSIAARFRAQINARSNDYPSVTFLIHGFRKPFNRRNHDSTSPGDFLRLQDSLGANGLGHTLFVPVFWDGLYGCCFSLDKSFRQGMANLYAEAQENAARVGSGLRPMITGLNLPVLNLLTFSLGASVAAHALYNIRPDSQPTPENRMVNICLMAPAIGGESWFQNYTIRNHNYQPKPDRYRICIAWNKNDFVLKKKDPKTGLLGPGPYKYGNTSLGCNHKGAVEKLKQYFKIHHPDSFITDVDLSETGKCHLIRCYASTENARKISSFFNMQ